MTMITPSYLGETIEYSSLHACRSTLEDPTQYAPDGVLLRVVQLPTSHPTSVAFGGPELDILYVTTIGARVLGVEPSGERAGALLAIEGLGTRGVASSRCPF